MQVFARKVDALDIDEQKSEELKTALSAVIASDVKSGFKSILGFFESNYEYANMNHGVWSLPNGDAFYEARLRSYTTTDYSAEEIHQIGLSEVDRIGARMKEIFLQLGYQLISLLEK